MIAAWRGIWAWPFCALVDLAAPAVKPSLYDAGRTRRLEIELGLGEPTAVHDGRHYVRRREGVYVEYLHYGTGEIVRIDCSAPRPVVLSRYRA